MRRRRTILVALLLLAIIANLIFFYVKTRPQSPAVYLDSTFSIADSDEKVRKQYAIMLSPDGTWQSKTGKPVDLLDALLFALPNTDSVDYSVVVTTRQPPTLGDTIRISRSLASNGICNFTYLNKVAESHSPYEPPLTISDYTLTNRGKLMGCKASSGVDAKHRTAKAEYDRIAKLRKANSASK